MCCTRICSAAASFLSMLLLSSCVCSKNQTENLLAGLRASDIDAYYDRHPVNWDEYASTMAIDVLPEELPTDADSLELLELSINRTYEIRDRKRARLIGQLIEIIGEREDKTPSQILSIANNLVGKTYVVSSDFSTDYWYLEKCYGWDVLLGLLIEEKRRIEDKHVSWDVWDDTMPCEE